MDVITFPVNLYTTSGLQILLHGVISLPDATSYDKVSFLKFQRLCLFLFSCKLVIFGAGIRKMLVIRVNREDIGQATLL